MCRLHLAASLILASCLLLQMFRHYRDVADIRELKEKIEQIQSAQKQMITDHAAVTESYIKAWENQQSTADLLISFGEYHRDRQNIIKANQKMVRSR